MSGGTDPTTREPTARHVLVTGAGRGIGRDIALHLASTTHHSLTLLSRTATEVEAVAMECRNRFAASQSAESGPTRFARPLPCDVSDPGAVAALPDPPEGAGPDVLVLNAGRFDPATLEATSDEAFESLIRDNLFTATRIVDRYLSGMRRSGSGLIIGVSSVGATRGLDPGGAYASAKHALTGYLRSLRMELTGHGIQVSILHLGQTWSSSWDGIPVDPRRLVDPFDVARLVATLIDLSPRTDVEELLVMPSGGPIPV